MAIIRTVDTKMLNFQKEFVTSKKKYPILVGGLGSGKTDAGILRACYKILENRNYFNDKNPYLFAIYMPNNSYFKKRIIPGFKEWLPKFGLSYKPNYSDFYIKVEDFAIIYMISLDAPKKLVGFEMHDSWIDELDILPFSKAYDSFDKIGKRNRAKKPEHNSLNTVCITTTPDMGTRGFTYDLAIKQSEESIEMKERVHLINAKTKYNTYLPADYMMEFINYPYKKFLAMAEGEFVDYANDPVYYNYDEDENFTDREWNGEILHIGMDFNNNNMSAVVGILEYKNRKPYMYIIDEISTSSITKKNIVDVPQMLQEIHLRYPNQEKRITIYPDASGDNKDSLNYNTSKVFELKKHFNVKMNYITSPLKPKNPLVDDRVTVVNQAFLDDKAERRIFINTAKCRDLKFNLLNQEYELKNDGTYVPSKKNNIDHMIDAFGYLVYYYFNPKYVHNQQQGSAMKSKHF